MIDDGGEILLKTLYWDVLTCGWFSVAVIRTEPDDL